MSWPKGKPAHNKGIRADPVERFWRFVTKTDGCWLWTGGHAGRKTQPYGWFRTSPEHGDRAHRFSYRLAHGEIPVGLMVLHTCDNRLCVRPDHLYLGTGTDNARDRDSRGRANPVRGERHAMAKLTNAQAAELRASHASGVRRRELAKTYGITQSAVSRIVNHQTHY